MPFCVTHYPAHVISPNALICPHSVVNFYQAMAKFLTEAFCGKKYLFYVTVSEGCSMEPQQETQKCTSRLMAVGACTAAAHIVVDQKSEYAQNRDLDIN